MRMITLTKTTLENSHSIFDQYLKSITGVNDDFWEEHILDSQIYDIQTDGHYIGIVGIHQNTNMTFFYVPPAETRYAQPAFSATLETPHATICLCSNKR